MSTGTHEWRHHYWGVNMGCLIFNHFIWNQPWPDDAALVLMVACHVKVAGVSNGKDVWREFPELSTVVQLHLKDNRKHTCNTSLAFQLEGWRLKTILSLWWTLRQPHLLSWIYGKLLVGVHCHQHRACVGLTEPDKRFRTDKSIGLQLLIVSELIDLSIHFFN